MIQQRSDCLVFETASGECIPCSAEELTVELIGEGSKSLTPEVIHNAAAALLHYFKYEVSKEKVTIGEFTEALVDLLQKLGYQVSESGSIVSSEETYVEIHLDDFVDHQSAAMEMAFFSKLRSAVKEALSDSAPSLKITGLRPCVLALSGSRRWNNRCRELSDHIVGFLRQCITTDVRTKHCDLIVR